MGHDKLRDRFHILYALEVEKRCKICERWVDGAWLWKWKNPIRGGLSFICFSVYVIMLFYLVKVIVGFGIWIRQNCSMLKALVFI